jgi:hypothetical protein
MPFTRRFVVTLLGCAPGLPLMLRSGASLGAGQDLDTETARLRSLLADPARARRFGSGYRAQFPDEARPAVLTGLIRASLQPGAGGDVMRMNRDVLLATLDTRVRAEFAAGDVVRIDGWVLGRTEARLCALCE